MLIFYKNKGILILVYFFVCFLVIASTAGALQRNYGGIFSKIDFYTTMGFVFLATSAWTYLTKDDYYKDRNGNKQKMDTINTFFWISMKVWAIIFLLVSIMFFGNLIFHYFN